MKHIFAFLLLPFLVACNSASTPEINTSDPVTLKGNSSITWDLIEDKTDTYNLTYPNFTGGPDLIVQSLNTDLPSGTRSFIEQAELRATTEAPWVLSVNPSYQYEDEQFLSLQLNTYDYAGGENGNSYYGVVNYDLVQDQFLAPAALFKDENYLSPLSEFLKSEVVLLKTDQDKNYVPEADERLNQGLSPEPQNFRTFVFEDGPEGRGLKFLFAPQQLGSADEGAFEILVPVGIIRDFVKPEYSAWFK